MIVLQLKTALLAEQWADQFAADCAADRYPSAACYHRERSQTASMAVA